jgi:hypothetical protein
VTVDTTVQEKAIGHLKSDHRMDRCWLKGAVGDALLPAMVLRAAQTAGGRARLAV